MLNLNSQEQKIINLLLKTVENHAPNTVVRIAGGWVRDKLLGLECHDLDVAVSLLEGQYNMSGLSFAKFVQKELGGGRIAVIDARPEQSKHLETAQLNIFGLDIDFTNLRKESYSESRIPVIETGTPEEDAFRRDLTINALFYNIHTKKIEDFTGQGLDDLKNKIARTPLDPVQTFLDDPLRILRTIRFCSKFQLNPQQNIFFAASDEKVKAAFKEKISKERIWAEMIGQEEPTGWKNGFLTGPDPYFATIMLSGLGYRDLVFDVSNHDLNPWDIDQNNPHHDLDIWSHTLLAFGHLIMRMPECSNPKTKAIRNLALLLHDLGKRDPNFQQTNSNGITQYKRHEERSAELAEEILTNLKAPADMKKRIVRLVAEHMRFHWLEDKPRDKALRKIVRDLEEDWENLLDISISDAYGKEFAWGDSSIAERYEFFRARTKELLENQQNEVKIKRPINGNELMEKFNLSPGPELGKLFNILDEELLENPNMTKEEAFELMQKSI